MIFSLTHAAWPPPPDEVPQAASESMALAARNAQRMLFKLFFISKPPKMILMFMGAGGPHTVSRILKSNSHVGIAGKGRRAGLLILLSGRALGYQKSAEQLDCGACTNAVAARVYKCFKILGRANAAGSLDFDLRAYVLAE